ncbi:arylamine N-acetyltransferase family protein [Dongia sedimenti]|uniref:Arylamine N-acetyltransferase n=1 Tax=Dongia sedimenti TaxID=3064282 RepID=A0ABU0YHA9_9PROT|nr:arylamine N-acetyltransferase [Rhodospirillaceae bacterium R-7]
MIDLDAYLARIGYAGPRAPSVETLRALHRAHFTSVPFENLDVVLKRPIRLDPASLQQKIVAERRGGYCFESNALFMHGLLAMGFAATPLAARVLYERSDPALPPRSHMLLMVDLEEGLYLADAAFGGQTPPQPLSLAVGVEQATTHEPYRLRRTEDGELDLQALMAGQWGTLYRFTLHPQLPVDFEHANWFTSTHPDSFFVNNLIAAMPGEGCRYTLFNREFRTRWPDGLVETEAIETAADLASVLQRRFALIFSEPELSRLFR